MSLTRIPFILVFCLLWSLTYTQELQSYKHVKVLSGHSVDVPVESNIYPDFLRRPERGSVSKFKFGYEEVYRIRYTAQAAFTGLDTVIYKTERTVNGYRVPFFEGFVVESRPVVAETDYYAVDIADGTMSLDVLSNDKTTGGNLKVVMLSYVSNGSASISPDQTSILFRPAETGYTRIGYTVCADGTCASGLAQIRVDNRKMGPAGDSSRYRIERDESVYVLVAPDFNPPSSTYYSGSLTRVADQIYHYEPPLGYSGMQTLRFARLSGGEQLLHLVTVEVVDPFEDNGWNKDDHFYTEVGNRISFSVTTNDLRGQIGQVYTNGLKGTLSQSSPGQFTYIPPSGFRGQTKFSYQTCAEGRCDIADVHLTVHNYEPLYPVVDVYAIREKPLHIGYDVPIDDYHFSLTSDAAHGNVTVAQDGKSLTYLPDGGFSGTDAFQLNYCAGTGFCQSLGIQVKVQNLTGTACTDCVWPGDHNHDGMVDVQDAVVLAINLGHVGPARGGFDTRYWYGQSAPDWPAAITEGTPNLKYVDSNGDGLTSTSDLNAVGLFYERAHAIPPTPPVSMEPLPLNLQLLTPEVSAGDWAVVEVSVGQENLPVHDLMGLSFSFEVGSRFVDSSSIRFTLAENGIINPLNSVIAFAKSVKDGRIDVGIGKTDKQPIRGHGVLGQIRFIVEEDLNGFRSVKDILNLPVKITRIGVLQKDQEPSSLPDVEEVMRLTRETGQAEISFYPNPAQSWLQVEGTFKSLQIVNLQGQSLISIDNGAFRNAKQLDLQRLQSGLYLVRIEAPDGEVSTRKLEVIR